MTKLSESQKRKIEAEEKYRAEVKRDLKKKKKTKGCLVTLGLFVGFFVLIGIFSGGGKKGETTPTSSPTPATERDFQAGVDFTGTQFVIANLDDLACQNAKMEINGGLLKGGYVYEGHTLVAGEIYEVGALQFAKGDGTRFNPFETKPKNFFIICRGTNALDGASWFGNFD